MKKILSIILIGVLMLSLFSPKKANAQARVNTIILPSAEKTGGIALMEALNLRKSSRSFSKTKISEQDLSNLLWAAWGYNRDGLKKRTAPSSMNKQEISVYCALETGLYYYNAKAHQLELILAQDLRAHTGKQPFVATAPLNLIYVADSNKQSSLNASHTNSGFIAQNVYLYCASADMGTVVRAWYNDTKLHKAMELKKHQNIILCQTVGYHKE